jgi:hypothetical protein
MAPGPGFSAVCPCGQGAWDAQGRRLCGAYGNSRRPSGAPQSSRGEPATARGHGQRRAAASGSQCPCRGTCPGWRLQGRTGPVRQPTSSAQATGAGEEENRQRVRALLGAPPCPTRQWSRLPEAYAALRLPAAAHRGRSGAAPGEETPRGPRGEAERLYHPACPELLASHARHRASGRGWRSGGGRWQAGCGHHGRSPPHHACWGTPPAGVPSGCGGGHRVLPADTEGRAAWRAGQRVRPCGASQAVARFAGPSGAGGARWARSPHASASSLPRGHGCRSRAVIRVAASARYGSACPGGWGAPSTRVAPPGPREPSSRWGGPGARPRGGVSRGGVAGARCRVCLLGGGGAAWRAALGGEGASQRWPRPLPGQAVEWGAVGAVVQAGHQSRGAGHVPSGGMGPMSPRTSGCKRRQTASARASLPLFAAPEPQRWASGRRTGRAPIRIT